MSDLLVVVPSRGRPQNIVRLESAWAHTASEAKLLVVVDNDDPTAGQYPSANLVTDDRLGLAGTLNREIGNASAHYAFVGFMGDDHVPRTPGWDAQVIAALRNLGTGVVYGNDLFQGENLPTAVFTTADIPRTLGYFCPPGMRHMYLDNVWLAWGRALGGLRYLPDVIIEHMHPAAGKGEGDATYAETNASTVYDSDLKAFEAYLNGAFTADMAKFA